MTKFIKLSSKSEGLKQLELFEVIENEANHSWLVRYLNKRMSYKWFYDYKTANEYFNKSMKRNFIKN